MEGISGSLLCVFGSQTPKETRHLGWHSEQVSSVPSVLWLPPNLKLLEPSDANLRQARQAAKNNTNVIPWQIYTQTSK